MSFVYLNFSYNVRKTNLLVRKKCKEIVLYICHIPWLFENYFLNTTESMWLVRLLFWSYDRVLTNSLIYTTCSDLCRLTRKNNMYPRSCDLVSCKNDLLARMFDLLDLRYYRFNILYIWLCISWVLTTWICILCQKPFMQHILFNNSKLIKIQTFKRWLFKVKEERLENSPDKADRDIGKKKK